MAIKITGTNTAAAPGITGDDTDTGLFYGTNEIGFSTGGTSRATVDSSGNLNIPNDSGKIRLGTGNDLEVYHDGSNSFLKDITGDIIVRSADDVYIQPQNGELGVSVIGDGGVELYFDNSKRLETTNGGIRVHGPASGQCGVDVWATSGDSAYLKLITDNGVNPPDYYQVLHQNSDNSFRIQNYGDGSYEDNIVAKHGGAIELYFDASKKLETTSDGAQVTGALKVKVAGSAYGDGLILEDENSTSQSELTHVDGVLYITSNPPGATHVTLDSSGNLAIPRDNAKFKVGASDDLQIWHDSSTNKSIIKETGTGSFDIQGNWVQILNEAGDESKAIFKDDGAVELYHDNNKVAETIVDGLRVTAASNDAELQIRSRNQDGATLIRFASDDGDDNNDWWRIRADGGGNALGIQNYADGAWEANIVCRESGGTELYYDNSKKFETTALGVQIPDSVSFCHGNGADIRMWFQDSSNPIAGYIDCNQGHFYIRNNVNDVDGGDIYIQGRSGEDSIIAKNDGAVELYYDNSKKLSTTENGIEIHDLDDTTTQAKFISSGGTLGSVYGNSNDSAFGLLNTSGEWIVEGVNNGTTKLYYDNVKKFETTSTGSTVESAGSTDVLLTLKNNIDQNASATCTIQAEHDVRGSSKIVFGRENADDWSASWAAQHSFLAFHTFSGANNLQEKVRITGAGSLLVGTTTNSINSSAFGVEVASHGGFYTSRNVNGNSGVVQNFGNAGEHRVYGDGDVQNTNNSYGQISDQTLKQDIVDAASQWDDIQQVKVRKFRFKDRPTAPLQIGVVAQELETISPGLVKEVFKNGEDGDKVKSVKYSVLYMKAIKALQEAMAKIETLEVKVAALEAS